MLTNNLDYFRSKPVNIPKITILLDHGYHPDKLRGELEQVYPQIMRKIRFELSTKPSKQEKAAQGKSGFVPAVARWVIERSNAWMERCKSLVKNFERTLSHATTKLNLCFVRLMIQRLATGCIPVLQKSSREESIEIEAAMLENLGDIICLPLSARNLNPPANLLDG